MFAMYFTLILAGIFFVAIVAAKIYYWWGDRKWEEKYQEVKDAEVFWRHRTPRLF